ncbi:aminomethyltransferase family protein [Vagococcus sp. WN89Y]|uniref:aminomethyltransferase family protein n=1 Tax=Vagococcus sp. WN89Y TaxID=3457258 RepID=UPI003FCEA752
MTSLYDLHIERNARMGVYNNHAVPSAYHEPDIEYRAVRENVLLIDYSHMAIVSVMGEDAWILVNYLASADVSVIRDEQGIYSLVLSENGLIRGDIYVLCTADGYFILSENLSAFDIIDLLNGIIARAENLDIQNVPEIKSMDEDDWGAILLEGPYAWEVMTEIYGYDIIGLPFFEFMYEDDGLLVFRCGKHGEFAYLMIGQQNLLAQHWLHLLTVGQKYLLKAGGLDYQKIVRVENTGWDENIYAAFSRNPVELQLQWAIQYDKENFIGKEAVEKLSCLKAGRKLVGVKPTRISDVIQKGDNVFAGNNNVGAIIRSVFSPALNSFVALALMDKQYACSDIEGFTLHTANGPVSARTANLPFLNNLSMFVNPVAHSFIDASKFKNFLAKKNNH